MNTEQKYKLLSMMGYRGPKDETMMSGFIRSSPAMEAKFGKFMNAAKKFNQGGLVGYAAGGSVDYATELNKIYNQEVGRDVRTPGKEFYLPFLQSGKLTLDQVRADIQKNVQKNVSGLNEIYRDILGRDIDEAGKNFYLSALNDGRITLDQVRADVQRNVQKQNTQNVTQRNTQQNVTQQQKNNQQQQPAQQNNQQDYTSGLNKIYQDILGRDIGSSGLEFYLPFLKSGQLTLDQVRADVQKNANNETLVKNIFQESLGRAPTPAEIQKYVVDVTSGKTTTDQLRTYLGEIKDRTSTGGSTGATTVSPTGNTALQDALTTAKTTGQGGVDYWTGKLREAQESGTEADVQKALQGLKKAQEDLAYDQSRISSTLPSTGQIAGESLTNPIGMITQAVPSQMTVSEGQTVDQSAGVPTTPFTPAQASTTDYVSTANIVTPTPASLMQAATVSPLVDNVVGDLQAATGQVSDQAQVTPAQQTESAVSQLQAAQGEAIMMENPMQREIQAGELVSGTAVDAAKVEALNAQLQAAQATPSEKATVQGQLEDLMQDFEGGNTPAWAAGAIRNANAILAQRGLGASSMAGQAVIQATMEAALPIAQADAATRASFEAQNLSNRQQVAMFAAQQRAAFLQQEFDQEFQTRVQNAARVADIANMNFTAEQQIALENSRAANTVNLQNLSNRQAMVMAEAAALSNLDMANLNNRQQAAVQNAQNFLQMDLANLNNQQQTAIFKAQSRVNALLSDQAATNAAAQFNAASQNQTNQFFADLQSTISRFNSDQMNAMSQFNAGETNAIEKLNSSLEEQRQQFEANNRLIVAQANAKWRQDIATINTAVENEALMESVKQANGLTTTALDNLWQRERDLMNYAFLASESYEDRALNILLADKNLEAVRDKIDAERDAARDSALGSFAAELFFG